MAEDCFGFVGRNVLPLPRSKKIRRKFFDEKKLQNSAEKNLNWSTTKKTKMTMTKMHDLKKCIIW